MQKRAKIKKKRIGKEEMLLMDFFGPGLPTLL
jgi:hypothetical protein